MCLAGVLTHDSLPHNQFICDNQINNNNDQDSKWWCKRSSGGWPVHWWVLYGHIFLKGTATFDKCACGPLLFFNVIRKVSSSDGTFGAAVAASGRALPLAQLQPEMAQRCLVELCDGCPCSPRTTGHFCAQPGRRQPPCHPHETVRILRVWDCPNIVQFIPDSPAANTIALSSSVPFELTHPVLSDRVDSAPPPLTWLWFGAHTHKRNWRKVLCCASLISFCNMASSLHICLFLRPNMQILSNPNHFNTYI